MENKVPDSRDAAQVERHQQHGDSRRLPTPRARPVIGKTDLAFCTPEEIGDRDRQDVVHQERRRQP